MTSTMLARLVVWLAVGLVFSSPALTQGRLEPDQVREFEKIVKAEIAQQNIPAISISVARRGRLAWSQGFGLADLENSIPAKAGTMFRLASISKPITAVAALQLAERGKLDLDAPVQKYVPEFPPKPWPITSRQLLAHLGGVRHYNNPEEVGSTKHYGNMLEPLAIFAQDALVAEPGTKQHYTTYGYVLLGAVVERAAGIGFMDYLRENVFKPAAMGSIQADNHFTIIPNRARGYRKRPDGRLENCGLADTSNKIAGGGMISTAEDLVKFALAVREGILLQPQTVERMLAPQKLPDGSQSNYGLGWNLIDTKWGKVVGHSGGQQGVSTLMLMHPQTGAGVAVMCNLERARLEPLVTRILALLAK